MNRRCVLAVVAAGFAAAPTLCLAAVDEAELAVLGRQWLSRAESGDVVPAWDTEERPVGIPESYAVAPPIIKETTRRCRFNYDKNRRSLLQCLDVTSVYPRNDLPRAQLTLPVTIMPVQVERRPVANVQVR